MKTNEKNQKNGMEEIERKKFSPFCRKDCRVCNSDFVVIIHEMIELRKPYIEICAYLFSEKGYKISPASISRHYQNYKEQRKVLTAEKMKVQLDQETDVLSRHRTQSTRLADLLYQEIESKIRTGVLDVSISDYEKIVKLYHQVLNGDGNAMDEMVSVFRKASEKYGFQLEQGQLFEK